jgi:hypothetical protein
MNNEALVISVGYIPAHSVRLIGFYLNRKASALLQEIKQMNVFMKHFDCLTLNDIATSFHLVSAVGTHHSVAYILIIQHPIHSEPRSVDEHLFEEQNVVHSVYRWLFCLM